jgi:hypothetical protein
LKQRRDIVATINPSKTCFLDFQVKGTGMFETSYLLTTLVFSSIGLGHFIYGKKQKQKIVFYSRIGLMVFPYAVTTNPGMIVTGVVLMAVPKMFKYLNWG